MSKQQVEQLLQETLQHLKAEGVFPIDLPKAQIDMTKEKSHGDFASNVALLLAKPLGKKPREVAECIVKNLRPSPYIDKVEIAGPGFINFFMNPDSLYQVLPAILEKKEMFGRSTLGQKKKVLVEFVSSNPTGPLHVGHGRHAAFGATVSDLLEAVGFDVTREYYVNDAGRQMDILAVSVWLRYLALTGEHIVFPSNAYQGHYVTDIARLLYEKIGKSFYFPAAEVFSSLPKDEPEGGDKELYIDAVIARAETLLGKAHYLQVFDLALERILADIRDDLTEFGVTFQRWFSEREFVKGDTVERYIEDFKTKGLVYEREGALWFRSTDLGDEKDRVLLRSNGQRTYFANDLGYHINKFERGFDTAIDIFGSDHHGYIPRMKAGLTAYGIESDKLTYLTVQFVMLYRGGKQVQMSTRSGSFVTLRELRDEVGNDAARFFYVMRKSEQHMDFDLDLAKSQSNENPVYYVQYAHARICSVFRQLEERAWPFDVVTAVEGYRLLKEPEELRLLSTLTRYPECIEKAALQHEPHLLTVYLRELATDFHGLYNAHAFLVEDAALRNARLTLIFAARQVLSNGLKLLGVSAPNSM